MQADKPGSVVFHHLSRGMVAHTLHRLTHRHERAALNAGLFSLSTRKVYPAMLVAKHAVGSYPTFSPLPMF